MREACDGFDVVDTRYRLPAPAAGGYDIDDWVAPELTGHVHQLARRVRFDAMLVNYVMYSRCLMLAPPGTVRVLDTHDRFAGRQDLLAALGRRPDFFWTSLPDETRGVRRADLVLAIQSQENAYFNELTGGRSHELGHLIGARDLPRSRRNRAVGQPLAVGLVGSRNQVNSEYFKRFIERWHSLPRPERDRLVLKVAGNIADDPVVRGAGGASEVEFCGVVPELGAFYSTVDVVVNPIEQGTGQKIKSVEAIAYGVPIVSTAEGFAGIESDRPYHRAEDQGALVRWLLEAATVQRLLDDMRSATAGLRARHLRKLDRQFDGMIDAIDRIRVARGAQ